MMVVGRWSLVVGKTLGYQLGARIFENEAPDAAVTRLNWEASGAGGCEWHSFVQLFGYIQTIRRSGRQAAMRNNRTPAVLLTTRPRVVVAIGLTIFVLILAIRDVLHLGYTASGSLLPLEFGLHGWPLLAANLALYTYLCWLGFCFIRGAHGRERIFMCGWSTAYLISPIEILRPHWHVAIDFIVTLGLTIALLAAISLFPRTTPVSGNSDA